MTTATKRRAGERTRAAILREAVSLATVHGLEGLSIGDLAAALGMSKSGLYAHFGSKQDLQLATVEEAERIFEAEVLEPAQAAPAGVPQLVAVCEAFFDHLERRTFPGGCFFAGAVLEMGPRPGPVNERVAAFQRSVAGVIRQFVVSAMELGQLPDEDDADLLAFEVNGIILAANTSFVLNQQPEALEIARQVVRRRLDVQR
ncbi:MAG: TetR/AcrR family transcriptional regulator [Acidimicrobiales bacterium]